MERTENKINQNKLEESGENTEPAAELNTAEKLQQPARGPLWRRFVTSCPIFMAASAVYALFYAFCLYKNTSGIIYPFFAAGTLLYFFFCIRKSEVTWKKSNLFYAVSIELLGISIFLSADWKLNAISKWAIFFLLLVMVLRSVYDDSGWHAGKYAAAVAKYLGTCFRCLPAPFQVGREYAQAQKGLPGKEEKKQTGRQILLGLAVAVPLLFILIQLLGRADAVFANLFSRFLVKIRPLTVMGVGWKLLCGFFLSFCMAAAAFRKNIEERCRERKRLEPVSGITLLSLVSLLYLAFCAVQIVYLFSNQGRLPEGMQMTYAEYAHQGFFSLLAVCVLNLCLVVFCLRAFGENKILKMLLTLISGCTYIMIASSAYRMYLYVQEYGLTWLRLMVWWALLVITIWMTLVIMTVYRERFPLFKAGLAVVTVLYLCIAFAKPDAVVARYEVNRYEQALAAGTPYCPDMSYFAYGLGADAAPVFLQEETVSLFRNIWKPQENPDIYHSYDDFCGWYSDYIAMNYYSDKGEAAGFGSNSHPKMKYDRTFNLSVYRARKAADRAEALINLN